MKIILPVEYVGKTILQRNIDTIKKFDDEIRYMIDTFRTSDFDFYSSH